MKVKKVKAGMNITATGILNYSARQTVQKILDALTEHGYIFEMIVDEEGYRNDTLGETETETIYFSNGGRRGWVCLVYDNFYLNECDGWDGSDVVCDFGGDIATVALMERLGM